ncbi:Oidioi.mRNA.OKI2018_I69.PAR.g12078.t1.cds [Oikopleura dioica]|uniref:Oidioi.mRNA.OKI2018_I69.PAR.g12078.t1.cds n=1 Tax=Oikopleura dioica TaxID=34765 RepID=A0ABN7S1U9_OIKDI|nr:Oidioi.mRNA.OKI2018_I69.PAR.g12078.t1.cds [Oikopleura dioica]
MTEGKHEIESNRRPSVGQMSFCSMTDVAEGNGHRNGTISENWITLNVGGKYFTTTKTTLKKDPKSFLARLASIDANDVDQLNDLGSEKDETGAFLIGNLINAPPIYIKSIKLE